MVKLSCSVKIYQILNIVGTFISTRDDKIIKTDILYFFLHTCMEAKRVLRIDMHLKTETQVEITIIIISSEIFRY